jgi:hypothetical protein
MWLFFLLSDQKNSFFKTQSERLLHEKYKPKSFRSPIFPFNQAALATSIEWKLIAVKNV